MDTSSFPGHHVRFIMSIREFLDNQLSKRNERSFSVFCKQQRLQEWSLRNPSPTPTLANVGVASTTRAQDLLPYLLAARLQRRHRFRESRLREELSV